MNNSVIKLQLESLPQETMNNLCIKRGCYPFEKCPWVFSLCHHNPKGENLFFSIGIEGRDDELLARFVRFYTEFKGDIYISLERVSDFDNIESLVETFNSKLFASQESLKLIVEKNNIYMLGYEIKSVEIIKKLNESGITIVLVEQNAKLALSIADRGYVLETGKIILSGTGEELLNNENVKKAYLGS